MEAAGIGHNMPSLSDRIFSDPEVTIQDVLDAVVSHIRKNREDRIAELTERATRLEANSNRLPQNLDENGSTAALELLTALSIHEEAVIQERAEIIDAAKGLVTELTTLCKPLDAGLASLEKKIRPLMSEYLVRQLDAHNATLADGESLMTSISKRGPSGGNVSITDNWKASITDPNLIPRHLCVPDLKLIEAALANNNEVPGTEKVRAPSIRVAAGAKN